VVEEGVDHSGLGDGDVVGDGRLSNVNESGR